MSAYAWIGVTLIVINAALFLVVLFSLPVSIKRNLGTKPSLLYLFVTAATVIWMWRALAWQA